MAPPPHSTSETTPPSRYKRLYKSYKARGCPVSEEDAQELAEFGFKWTPSSLECHFCQQKEDYDDGFERVLLDHIYNYPQCPGSVLATAHFNFSASKVERITGFRRLGIEGLNRPFENVGYQWRLSTFDGFPSKKKCPTPEQLAQAGFIYSQLVNDRVFCVYCGLSLDQWQPGDDAISEHDLEKQGYCYYLDTYSRLEANGARLDSKLSPATGGNIVELDSDADIGDARVVISSEQMATSEQEISGEMETPVEAPEKPLDKEHDEDAFYDNVQSKPDDFQNSEGENASQLLSNLEIKSPKLDFPELENDPVQTPYSPVPAMATSKSRASNILKRSSIVPKRSSIIAKRASLVPQQSQRRRRRRVKVTADASTDKYWDKIPDSDLFNQLLGVPAMPEPGSEQASPVRPSPSSFSLGEPEFDQGGGDYEADFYEHSPVKKMKLMKPLVPSPLKRTVDSQEDLISSSPWQSHRSQRAGTEQDGYDGHDMEMDDDEHKMGDVEHDMDMDDVHDMINEHDMKVVLESDDTSFKTSPLSGKPVETDGNLDASNDTPGNGESSEMEDDNGCSSPVASNGSSKTDDVKKFTQNDNQLTSEKTTRDPNASINAVELQVTLDGDEAVSNSSEDPSESDFSQPGDVSIVVISDSSDVISVPESESEIEDSLLKPSVSVNTNISEENVEIAKLVNESDSEKEPTKITDEGLLRAQSEGEFSSNPPVEPISGLSEKDEDEVDEEEVDEEEVDEEEVDEEEVDEEEVDEEVDEEEVDEDRDDDGYEEKETATSLILSTDDAEYTDSSSEVITESSASDISISPKKSRKQTKPSQRIPRRQPPKPPTLTKEQPRKRIKLDKSRPKPTNDSDGSDNYDDDNVARWESAPIKSTFISTASQNNNNLDLVEIPPKKQPSWNYAPLPTKARSQASIFDTTSESISMYMDEAGSYSEDTPEERIQPLSVLVASMAEKKNILNTGILTSPGEDNDEFNDEASQTEEMKNTGIEETAKKEVERISPQPEDGGGSANGRDRDADDDINADANGAKKGVAVAVIDENEPASKVEENRFTMKRLSVTSTANQVSDTQQVVSKPADKPNEPDLTVNDHDMSHGSTSRRPIALVLSDVEDEQDWLDGLNQTSEKTPRKDDALGTGQDAILVSEIYDNVFEAPQSSRGEIEDIGKGESNSSPSEVTIIGDGGHGRKEVSFVDFANHKQNISTYESDCEGLISSPIRQERPRAIPRSPLQKPPSYTVSSPSSPPKKPQEIPRLGWGVTVEAMSSSPVRKLGRTSNYDINSSPNKQEVRPMEAPEKSPSVIEITDDEQLVEQESPQQMDRASPSPVVTQKNAFQPASLPPTQPILSQSTDLPSTQPIGQPNKLPSTLPITQLTQIPPTQPIQSPPPEPATLLPTQVLRPPSPKSPSPSSEIDPFDFTQWSDAEEEGDRIGHFIPSPGGIGAGNALAESTALEPKLSETGDENLSMVIIPPVKKVSFQHDDLAQDDDLPMSKPDIPRVSFKIKPRNSVPSPQPSPTRRSSLSKMTAGPSSSRPHSRMRESERLRAKYGSAINTPRRPRAKSSLGLSGSPIAVSSTPKQPVAEVPRPSIKALEQFNQDIESAQAITSYLETVMNSPFQLYNDSEGVITGFIAGMPENEKQMTIEQWMVHLMKTNKTRVRKEFDELTKIHHQQYQAGLEWLEALETED